MINKNQIIPIGRIQNLIFTVRSVQVMLDSDLAKIYGVDLKRLNEQVKRNLDRFPENFRFQLTKEEYNGIVSQPAASESNSLRSQNATLESKRGKYRKYLPFVFSEQGVAMLSAVLRSETAIKVSVQVIQAFVEMRKFIAGNALVFQRLDTIERKQLETDGKFEKVFRAIEAREVKPANGIFFDGQIFDAYVFIKGLIRKAKSSIILIDNYVDETVLMMLSRRKKNCKALIYTQKITGQLKLDLKKHNEQYPAVEIKRYDKSHDRFLILDKKAVYHIGASLKDLGKKWFAFSLIKFDAKELIKKLEGGA